MHVTYGFSLSSSFPLLHRRRSRQVLGGARCGLRTYVLMYNNIINVFTRRKSCRRRRRLHNSVIRKCVWKKINKSYYSCSPQQQSRTDIIPSACIIILLNAKRLVRRAGDLRKRKTEQQITHTDGYKCYVFYNTNYNTAWA